MQLLRHNDINISIDLKSHRTDTATLELFENNIFKKDCIAQTSDKGDRCVLLIVVTVWSVYMPPPGGAGLQC